MQNRNIAKDLLTVFPRLAFCPIVRSKRPLLPEMKEICGFTYTGN